LSLIKPISSLSISRAVNLYAIVLFLSFGILLYWLALDRYQTFIDSHEVQANNATRIAAFEISKTLKEKQRNVDMFVESSKELISKLSSNLEDNRDYQQLISRLKKYQPDLSSFSIINQKGESIIGDFDGSLDQLCLEDIKNYLDSGERHIRLHPQNNTYHYDIISTFADSEAKRIFFVSFHADEIYDILGSLQPENHSLIIVTNEANNLIEITSQGGSKSNNDRMNGDKKFRLLSTNEVKNTDWQVVDIRNEGLFSGYREKVISEYMIAFYALLIIVLFMRHILLNQDEKRNEAEIRLQENNKKIKELNSKLDLLSKTDSLTSLFNRRYLQEMLTKEWNRSLRTGNALSCVLFDIDYFKYYNDCYGHQAGDECLKEISVLMKDSFSRATDVIARYGGEEFIVIIADSGVEDTVAAVENFLSELKKLNIPHKASVKEKYVTISAGIVNQAASRDESIEDFIRKADEALYLSKAQGRNQWTIYKP